MNGTNAIVSKKVMPLVAVLILCAACLVTVAYAYNASYQDTVKGSDVSVDETSKYIYITGSGLSYPAKDEFTATTSVQYDTVTTKEGTTATPTDFEINGLKSTNTARPVTYADGIATIKIGDITIKNKNTALVNVYVTVSKVTSSDLPEGKVNLFREPIYTSNIYMKADEANDYSNVFKLTNNAVTVGVYLVAEVDTTPEVLGVNPQPVTINDQGELATTVQSILYVPAFDIEFSATAGDKLTIVSGEITSADITSIKESAAADPKFSAKLINEDGASITMDSTAIGLLGNNDAEFEVNETTIDGDYTKAYEIEFGDNHFGTGNLTISIPYNGEKPTEPIMVAYLNNGVVDEVYEATYDNGYITFTTSHLSTYAVGTAAKLKANMAVELSKDGHLTYYNNLGDAIKTGRTGTCVITLFKDVEESGYYGVCDTTDLTLILNGHKLKVTNPTALFGVTDQSAKITILGTAEGSEIEAVNYILFNNTTTQKMQKFDLDINGGTYVATHAFIPYNANSVTVIDAKFDVTESALWFGNIGAKKVTISNIEVESDSTGVYLGSVKEATVKNAKITAAGTALEIKSGNVKIIGGEFTGGVYSISDKIVNHNGTGGAKAVLVVNNGYCREVPGCDSVNVTMDNVTLRYSDESIVEKQMVVYTDADVDDKGKDLGKDKDIAIVWKDNTDKIVTFYNGTSPDITINGVVAKA